jgi:hypothetical protein
MQNSIGGLRPTGEETEFDGTTRSEQTAPTATAIKTSPPPGLLQMGITTPPSTPQGSFSSKFSPPLPVQFNPQVHMSHALPGHVQPLAPPRSPAPNSGGDGESGLLRDLVERYRGEMERLRSELNILRHENSALAEEIHSVMLQVTKCRIPLTPISLHPLFSTSHVNGRVIIHLCKNDCALGPSQALHP